MNICGKRSDGALLLNIGSGMAVILRGNVATKAMDLTVLDTKCGPWEPTDNSLARRMDARKQLDKSRMVDLVVLATPSPMLPPMPPPNMMSDEEMGEDEEVIGDESEMGEGEDPEAEDEPMMAKPTDRRQGERRQEGNRRKADRRTGDRRAADRPIAFEPSEVSAIDDSLDLGDRSKYPDGKYPGEGGQSVRDDKGSEGRQVPAKWEGGQERRESKPVPAGDSSGKSNTGYLDEGTGKHGRAAYADDNKPVSYGPGRKARGYAPKANPSTNRRFRRLDPRPTSRPTDKYTGKDPSGS